MLPAMQASPCSGSGRHGPNNVSRLAARPLLQSTWHATVCAALLQTKLTSLKPGNISVLAAPANPEVRPVWAAMGKSCDAPRLNASLCSQPRLSLRQTPNRRRTWKTKRSATCLSGTQTSTNEDETAKIVLCKTNIAVSMCNNC